MSFFPVIRLFLYVRIKNNWIMLDPQLYFFSIIDKLLEKHEPTNRFYYIPYNDIYLFSFIQIYTQNSPGYRSCYTGYNNTYAGL